MSTVTIEPLVINFRRENPRFRRKTKLCMSCSLNHSAKLFLSSGSTFISNFNAPRVLLHTIKASSSSTETDMLADTFESTDVFYKQTFALKRTETVEGKIIIKLDQAKDQRSWQLTVGCNIPGKWILHWGVNYIDDIGSVWDQPPDNMIPPGSITVKDYAIETPLKKSSESEIFYEVKIDFKPNSGIAAINFVLKDEETGTWYQHRGIDFKVPLVDYLQDNGNLVGANKGFSIWPGWPLGQLSKMLLKSKVSDTEGQDKSSWSRDPKQENKRLEGFYAEQPISKEVTFDNSVSVSVKKCPETAKNLLYLETDLPADVVVHWGVCREDAKEWEISAAPYPPETIVLKKKALRTLIQPKERRNGCWRLFTVDKELEGFLFVLKLNENTWLKCVGNDFYIRFSSSSTLPVKPGHGTSKDPQISVKSVETNQEASQTAHTDGIINEIRNLVSGISSEKGRETKTKEVQEHILQEIEKLAAEAYSIFRSSIPTFSEEAVVESATPLSTVKISSGTGSGFEILCQGFNWESHKSGRWYMELKEKAEDLSSLGFTVIWLPPPTDSVSPEGYMPRDLYNLNSRYGSCDELKDLVKKFHEVGIKVLGDVVLNHRCAQYQNQNGIWNIFGGRLNWDDRAVVADDPHFQGRGNKSSGDSFHAAPNIDHSQEFVRKDLKEWLHWLRNDIGYDGWRLDFVRGFWGGYIKDYIDATEPYFAVGEYWDSLSYTFGEMDHNQDAHRQRIIDWINATNGTAGAFDVTTKGILHGALEKCEYWRLSDKKGKPPGVVGWWPSRAVTFIENHDTGSTQGHWRFPRGKEMQGYAYILTHSGTPSVFYDHLFSQYRSEIASLISLRRRNQIHCRSTVKITKAERDVYAAIVDEKVAVKIGPGYYEPPSGPQRWSSAFEGRDYKVWEASLVTMVHKVH
ncbi:Alpha-amylase domain-containing protein/Alpha-amyl_C2 domain-containing protein [Cephalotus follicularis]|uniref:alpha-amylase n=1 Tax=Cephalotus follicularis TaxID=3775 RepID=A0A1Q3D576_CEPFO|nr:Alpha-amylase domain-containing protein/Alpha-amyl_C2 domain-containing protein [Cephalotus follicularis]